MEYTGRAQPVLPGAPFPLDIDRLLGDVNRTFNPLHNDRLVDFHVSGAQDGYVFLSVALPEGMTRGFVTLLESLCGFMRAVDVKSRSASAQARAMDPAKIKERDQRQADFREEVCTLFDSFTAQGMERKEAVKRTNSALKASGSPWASYDVVLSVLRSCGRLRKVKSRP
ncbi:hypothetical protein [Geobacter pickeringii]|uniref:Uncharacterized protein n=1 Tax=Geobacter pickeringii TaxID=345632 RepID=A0A0B5BEJ4_9BACT|nr:hypothetical protein [Geobacter pickeringii]AJE04862.1 hypothetical protein GPICK_08195 [Geobacter pickeringii]